MGFGGATAAMVQSIRNNANQLAKRNNYFEKNGSSKYGTSAKIVDYKKMSPEQFETFKRTLKKEELARQKLLVLIFSGIMLTIITGIFYFLFLH